MSYGKILDTSIKVIDAWLTYKESQQELPGFQVCIRQKGKLIFSKAYGYENLSTKRPFRTSTTGRIASQSKVFTAALALWLEAKGLLSLRDRLVDLIPELNRHRDSSFKDIRLSDLLCHRSGMWRDSLGRDYWGAKEPFLSEAELIPDVLAHKLVYRPGLRTKYSNLDYAVLSLALQRVCGEPWEALVHKFLTEIGFDGRVYSDFSLKSPLAQGYLRNQTKPGSFTRIPHRRTNILSAAGGFCANTETTTEFFENLYLNRTILPAKQQKALQSNRWLVMNQKSDHYGLGTIFSEVGGLRYVGHSGGFPGFTSQTWVVPELEMTLGFMTNLGAVDTFNIIRGMAETVRAIRDNFSAREKSDPVVTGPMSDNYISTLYVVGKTRALALPLTGWLPTADLMIFKKKSNYFISDELSGYKSVGEPLRFTWKGKKISAVQFGGFHYWPMRVTPKI